MAHHNIFREELAIAYPTYGFALWEPDPGGQYNAVEVGDVGFIRDGYFQRLFNVLHPRDHPSHRNPSLVPKIMNHCSLFLDIFSRVRSVWLTDKIPIVSAQNK